MNSWRSQQFEWSAKLVYLDNYQLLFVCVVETRFSTMSETSIIEGDVTVLLNWVSFTNFLQERL